MHYFFVHKPLFNIFSISFYCFPFDDFLCFIFSISLGVEVAGIFKGLHKD
ncbi:hypothetical protein CLERM_051 [Coxiella-like endosymbiont]|nr:hypothetical protein CLERM_051 [Coxiella-like endosymbiont]